MPSPLLPNGAQLVEFGAGASKGRRFAVGQTFIAEWFDVDGGTAEFASAEETILFFPEAGGTLALGSESVDIPDDALVVAPAGDASVTLRAPGVVLVLATQRSDRDPARAINAPVARDARVKAVGAPFARTGGAKSVQVFPIAQLHPPPTNGRLRFLQSATMSINLVIYDGPRGRNALSPHAHTDFEQATLAIQGDYVHHLRAPWGPDADQWRDDVHLPAGPASMLLIPPHLIHTTEGVGEGRHVLMDIFAPPRRDFIQKGWVANAADYIDPLAIPA
jgi:hypothetical protein